jgi:hypothetical protein
MQMDKENIYDVMAADRKAIEKLNKFHKLLAELYRRAK